MRNSYEETHRSLNFLELSYLNYPRAEDYETMLKQGWEMHLAPRSGLGHRHIVMFKATFDVASKQRMKREIRECIGLYRSMINSGEEHSTQSTKVMELALSNLEKL